MTSAEDPPGLLGHSAAEQSFADAAGRGRLAHAWLLSGPAGIGKATFARQAAKFLLCDGGQPDLLGDPPKTLRVDPDHPAVRRIDAGGHGDLKLVARSADPKSASDAMRTRIVVDQVRELSRFFTRTSAEGGWRIAIVDGAEEMNLNAANALLKILEEPPAQSLILLTSSAPGRLLPTIRSRCRKQALRPLSETQVVQVLEGLLPALSADERTALARLSEGSPGRAAALAASGGLAVFDEMLAIFSTLPELDYVRIHKLADQFQRREGADRFRVWMDLFQLWLTRLVRGSADAEHIGEPVAGEAALNGRLAGTAPLDRWVELWEKTNELAARAESVNLDRKQVVLTTCFELERTARGA